MEQITVTHPNGTPFNLFSAEYMHYVKSCRHVVTNQETDVVEVAVDAAVRTDFRIGDTITIAGNIYRLNTLPVVAKDGTRADALLDYRMEFESRKYDMRYAAFLLPEGGRADDYTGTLGDWLRLVVANVNRLAGEYVPATDQSFLAGTGYYMLYRHTDDLTFKAGTTYYREFDGFLGRSFLPLTAGTDYNIGDYVLIWEQNQGNDPDYEPVRVMEASTDYQQAEVGKDYKLGLGIGEGNFYVRTNPWRTGTVPAAAMKRYVTKDYAGQNCLAVLQDLCKEYGYEYRIAESAGVFTVNILTPSAVDLSLRFGRGGGLYSITREAIPATDIITRLYAYGSTDNLYPSYRYGRLCLPGKSKENSYIEGSGQVAEYGMKEGVVTYDEIKPEFNSSVGSILGGDPLSFIDTSMFDIGAKWADTPADYAEFLGMRGMSDSSEARAAFSAARGSSKYMVAGTSPKVHFNSGNLAGYEFEIASFNSLSSMVTLVRDQESGFPRSDAGPGGMFAAGDEYVLVDIYLPEYYIRQAEQRLLQAANSDYARLASPLAVYTIKLTRGWVQMYHHQAADIVTAGNFVNLLDDDTEADDDIKIRSYTRNYLTEDEYEITLCNERRETYWERWWRREGRNLTGTTSGQRVEGGATTGTVEFTTDADNDRLVITGGKAIVINGKVLTVEDVNLHYANDGAHIVYLLPNGGRAGIRMVPIGDAPSALPTVSPGAIPLGVVSAADSNGVRKVTLSAMRGNTPAEDVTVRTAGGTKRANALLPAVRTYDGTQPGTEGVIYTGEHDGNVALWVWNAANGAYLRVGSPVPKHITGIAFANDIPQITAAGSYDYSAAVTPADTTDSYTIAYDIESTTADSREESGSMVYLHYMSGETEVVLSFSRSTGEMSVPSGGDGYYDTVTVTATATVGGEAAATAEQVTEITIN